MKELFAAIALFSFVSEVEAAPNYPVEEWCEEVAGAGGSYSYQIKKECLEVEARAQDEIGNLGPIEDRIAKWCDEVAHAGGPGSYDVFLTCVKQELAAKGE